MKSTMRERISGLLAVYGQRRKAVAALLFSAAFVVLGVASILHQRGIAATHEQLVLDCPFNGVAAHTHTAECYDETGALVCPLPERPLHTHTDVCYTETRELTCSQPEHTHGPECYDEDGNLVCGLEEHTHTDACYSVTRTLTCGQEEVTTEHVHGPGCFRTVTVGDDGVVDVSTPEASDQLSGQDLPAQTFTHQFKDVDENLLLSVEVSAPEGALPAGTTMQATWVKPEELSRKQQDAVDRAIARKTDGKTTVLQAVDISFVDAAGNEVEPAVPVTVTFASPLLDTDDKPLVVHIDDLTDRQLADQRKALDAGKSADQAEPKRKAQTVDTLTDRELAQRDLTLATDELAFDAEQFSTYVLALTTLRKTMTASDGATYTVTVDAPPEAGIPQDAQLTVAEVGTDTSEHDSYQAQALQALGAQDAQLARFFDITIMGADGHQIEPSVPVQVHVQLANAPTNAQASVVHFDDATGEPELVAARETDSATSFAAASFSVYGMVYTVDFHWTPEQGGQEGDSGQSYDASVDLSIVGGGVITLSELVERLGIAEDGTAFVADVATVEFTNPDLVAVARVDEPTTAGALCEALGVTPQHSAELNEADIQAQEAAELTVPDWALVSIAPFASEERLTITKNDGSQLVLLVTDASGVVKPEDSLSGNYFIVTYSNGKYYALTVDGGYVEVAYDTESGLYSYDGTENIEWSFSPSGNYYHIVGAGTGTYLTPYKWIYVSGGGLTYILPANIELTKNANGYTIKNTTDTMATKGIYLGWNPTTGANPGFAAKEATGAATVRLVKAGAVPIPKAYTVNYAVNNTLGGSLSGKYLDDQGKVVEVSDVSGFSNKTKTAANAETKQLNYKVTATPYSGYRFLRWENSAGQTVCTTAELPATTTVSKDGETFKAVFEQIVDTGSGNYPVKPVDSSAIADWRALYDSDDTMEDVSKTAQVYDYENRIYQIDLTASSHVQLLADDLQLAFVTDVSNSMLFPASLTYTGNKKVLNDTNLNNLADRGYLDKKTTYYVIADESSTSTVTAIFYSDGKTKIGGQKFDKGWYGLDASYYAKWMAGEKSYNDSDVKSRVKRLGTDKLHKNDALDKQYKIYLPNTNYPQSFSGKDALYAKTSSPVDTNRLYYLKSSVSSALGDLLDISEKWPASGVYAGLETFAKKEEVKFVFESNGKGSFIKIGGYGGSAATYEANKKQLDDGLSAITSDDGTAQDEALKKAKNFNWAKGSDTKKVVIFISDGAPNIKGSNGTLDKDDAYKAVKDAADDLPDDVTLITIGLSVDDVTLGKKVLHNIASEDPDYASYNATQSLVDAKRTLYYQAKNGSDLSYILQDIVRSLMEDATIEGSVKDEIDPAFYPVDENGNPLTSGSYIDKDGKAWKTGSQGPKGKVTFDSTKKTWTVSWDDQTISHSTAGGTQPGWHGKVLVKAKEDFLGGNSIPTNVKASINAEMLKAGSSSTKYPIPDGRVKEYNPESPLVNVDELSLDEDSSAWTVYLGTEVDPLDQLKKLWGKIKISEVVTPQVKGDGSTKGIGSYGVPTGSGQQMYAVASYDATNDARTPIKGKTAQTVALSDLVKKLQGSDLTADQWTTLVTTGSLTLKYQGDAAYGHGDEGTPVGSLVISLTQEALAGEPDLYDETAGKQTSPHATAVADDAHDEEHYTLMVTYVPTGAKNSDYHTTPGGSAGAATDPMTSTNTHVINVFKKGLRITKVSEGGTEIADLEAKFDLYREARTDEPGAKTGSELGIEGLEDDKHYVKVDTLTTGANGSATDTVDTLTALLDDKGVAVDTPYFLVETQAPTGYQAAATAIPLTLKIGDSTASSETTTYLVDGVASSGLKRWVQVAGVVVSPSDAGVKTYVLNSDKDKLTQDHVYAIKDYSIINNQAGVELPAAGGPGTTALTLLGSILMGAGAAWLVCRPRKKDEAA